MSIYTVSWKTETSSWSSVCACVFPKIQERLAWTGQLGAQTINPGWVPLDFATAPEASPQIKKTG